MPHPHHLSLAMLFWASTLVAQAAARHPNTQYIRAPTVPGFSASLTDRPRPVPFRLGAVLGHFGSEGDPEDLLLGDIRDAQFLPTGGIAVLDDKLVRLRLFSASARPQQALGREGGGPGEFARGVLALGTDSAGRLLVADLSRGLKVFIASKDGYRYVQALSLGFSPQAICLLGPVIVAVGLQAGRPEVFHTFDAKGALLRAFGSVYESQNLGLNYDYSRGPVVCDPAHHVIYFAVQHGFGDVRAYQGDGRPLWRTAIEGFQSNIVEERPRGYEIKPSPTGSHAVQSLVLVPGVGLLVQVGHRTAQDREDGAEFSTLTSFLLDPGSGRPTPLGTSLPLIRAATRSTMPVVGSDPVPHFEIRAWTAP